VRSAARFEDSPVRRGVAVVVLMAFLVLAGRLLGRSAATSETGSTWSADLVNPETGSTWAEDLVADRRFEWSLIGREIAAILLIVLLILARQLLS
jgi:hypothetical protein